MSFLYPSFLWALLAVAIPILIHLFYFRRYKTVYFTNVRFLREVKEESSSRNRLKHLLVLASRILAVIFLVGTFAQPFIPKKGIAVKRGSKAISIFVDNSYSMNARSEDVALFEKAKQRAREIVNAYTIDDEFQILSNDFEGRHQRLVGKEDALSLVDELKITPVSKTQDKILTRQKQALQSGTADFKIAYIISDFQKNIANLTPQILADTTIEVNVIPLQSVQVRNLGIDSCWFDAPVRMLNQTNQLIARIHNYGNEVVQDARLTLRMGNETKPVGNITLKPNETLFDTIPLTITKTGWQEADLSITDYPVQFDDTYYFTFDVAQQISMLCISDGASNRYIDAAFAQSPYFRLTNQQTAKLDYAKFASYQMIVLNEPASISSGVASELKQYVENGGNVLFFPSATGDKNSYNSFLSMLQANSLGAFDKLTKEVNYINTEEFVFKDVFENAAANLKLPQTTGSYEVGRARPVETLLRYRDGNLFLGKYANEKGNLFVCAAPLNTTYSNLAQSGEIFVPMVYKIALTANKDKAIAYTIGTQNTLETENRISAAEMMYKLKGSAEEFIPEQRNVGKKIILGINNQIKESGYYNLYLKPEEVLDKFAFNFDRKESDLACLTTDELTTQLGDNVNIVQVNNSTNLTTLIGELDKGVALWKWCIILALVFLAIEILLLRFWKG